jgi:L-threonylcarbamoyladenylate synthase
MRVGAISAEKIEEKCGIQLEKGESPAASAKHYVPNKPLIVNATSAESDDALLAFGTPFSNNCEYMLNLSLTADLNEAATNFFYMLHELDKTDAKRICVMPIPNRGIGAAINEKLKAGSQY